MARARVPEGPSRSHLRRLRERGGHLAADLRYLHVLPIYDMNPDLKRRRIGAILDLVGEAFRLSVPKRHHPIGWLPDQAS